MSAQKFDTEQAAREFAAATYPARVVSIIESRGEFHVETDDEMGFLRTWEREVFTGHGKLATKGGKR